MTSHWPAASHAGSEGSVSARLCGRFGARAVRTTEFMRVSSLDMERNQAVAATAEPLTLRATYSTTHVTMPSTIDRPAAVTMFALSVNSV